jgi:hypothetical protein
MSTAANGFLTWFNTWGSVMYAVMQMLFWAAAGFAAVYAALAYKRLVAHKIARHTAVDAKPVFETKVDIDKFVE